MRCFHVWLLVRLPCFPCVCPLFRCLLLFAILAAPSIFPFQFVPLLQCVFHTFPCVCLLSSSIRLSCPVPPPFYSLCPFLLSLLCVRLLTHALYFPCVSFVSRYLFLFVVLSVLPISVLGLSVSPSACFQPRCPHLPSAIPPFPHRLSLLFLLRSRVFLPLFSAPFLSFVFHLEKSSLLNRG